MNCLRTNCVLFAIFSFSTFALSQIIKIGAIFERNEDNYEDIFVHAINIVNKHQTLVPRIIFVGEVRTIVPGDDFNAMKETCSILQEGVAAIFGPESSSTSKLVQSICEKYEIPYIQIAWNHLQETNSFGINLYPHPSSLGRAYKDLIDLWNYGRFSIIYRDNEALVRLKQVIESFEVRQKFSILQHLKQELYKKVLKEVSKYGGRNIVIDFPIKEIHQLLRAADEFGLTTEYNSYIITSLDSHTENITQFWNGLTNITTFRMANVKVSLAYDQNVRNVARMTEKSLKIKQALIYDGVSMLAKAFQDFPRNIHTVKLNCNSDGKWEPGIPLLNYIKAIQIIGLTGLIQFDKQGRRMNFTLDVVQLKEQVVKIGSWNTESGLDIEIDPIAKGEEIEKTLRGRTLKITAVISEPYIREVDQPGLIGNDRYDGYCVDLLKHISLIRGFKYEISTVRDGSRGTKNNNDEWDGMIQELLYRTIRLSSHKRYGWTAEWSGACFYNRGDWLLTAQAVWHHLLFLFQQRADLAIGDLTINTDRENAVDFTRPFMNLGIGILFKKPARKEPTLFSFLFPFSTPVWIYMATAYLGLTVLIYILARLSPHEWINVHPCEMYPDVLDNQFNFLNSLWFTIGSLMQQGSEVAPRASSTRLAAGIWWFFTLIMVSTYTANLAAFLTSVRMQSPIKNVNDLANQKTIPFGCLGRGSTRAFFKKSDHEIFKKMSRMMEESDTDVFANSSEVGVARVEKGNYAFLMETMTILYNTERKCDLTQIGDKIVDINYGFALPQGSPYVSLISDTILALQENGTLKELEEKWWKIDEKCPDEKASISNTKLKIKSLGGVFLVLVIGIGLSIVLVLIEFIWATNNIPREERSCIFIELLKKIKDILLCSGSTRIIDRTSLYALDDSMTRSSLFGTTSAKTTATVS